MKNPPRAEVPATSVLDGMMRWTGWFIAIACIAHAMIVAEHALTSEDRPWLAGIEAALGGFVLAAVLTYPRRAC